jgi:hypothetical protein
MHPCPRCATPAVIAASDQLNAALARLNPADRHTVERAIVNLLRLVAHHNQPKEQPPYTTTATRRTPSAEQYYTTTGKP